MSEPGSEPERGFDFDTAGDMVQKAFEAAERAERQEREAERERDERNRNAVWELVKRLRGATAGERLIIGLMAHNHELRTFLQRLDPEAIRRVEYNAAAFNGARELVNQFGKVGYSNTDLLVVLHWAIHLLLEDLDHNA